MLALIAGPIVRKVGAQSAVVWLAIDGAADVRLRIRGPLGDVLAEGTEAAVAAAPEEVPNLYVVAVEAFCPADRRLVAGRRYTYEILVGGSALELTDFGLRDGEGPGFRLPEPTLQRLSFMHGSCRKPHGKGPDALAFALELLRGANPPQALVLTGDQIYADDVSEEVLEIVQSRPFARRGRHVRANAGFTSGRAEQHLLTLGEYARMYVYQWTRDRSVRRVLANVSTWMIFDDHEVTDDWCITGRWVDRVRDLPEGRRIEGEALAAYLLFQHWGNVGAALPVEEWLARPETLHTRPWSWTWDCGPARFIALDTRTRREYPTKLGSPMLMGEGGITAAIPDPTSPPDPGGSELLVVVSPPPLVLDPGLALGQVVIGVLLPVTAVDREGWAARPKRRQFLLDRLFAHGRALVLSGDVHHGYLATVRPRDNPGAVVVNAVASPLQNARSARDHHDEAVRDEERAEAMVAEAPVDTLDVAYAECADGEREEGLPGDAAAAGRRFKTSPVVSENHVATLRFSPREGGWTVEHRYHLSGGRTKVHRADF